MCQSIHVTATSKDALLLGQPLSKMADRQRAPICNSRQTEITVFQRWLSKYIIVISRHGLSKVFQDSDLKNHRLSIAVELKFHFTEFITLASIVSSTHSIFRPGQFAAPRLFNGTWPCAYFFEVTYSITLVIQLVVSVDLKRLITFSLNSTTFCINSEESILYNLCSILMYLGEIGLASTGRLRQVLPRERV